MIRPTSHAVLQGLRLYHMVRADLASARKAAQELLALGESTRESGYLVEGHRAIGVVRFFAGEFQTARDHLERGIALYDIAAHGRHALRYAEDPGASLPIVHRAGALDARLSGPGGGAQ